MSKENWLLPAGTFAIALVLSALSGPSFKAQARAAADGTQQTVPCFISVGTKITLFDKFGPGLNKGYSGATVQTTAGLLDGLMMAITGAAKNNFDKKVIGEKPAMEPAGGGTVDELETQFQFTSRAKATTQRFRFNTTGALPPGAPNGGGVGGTAAAAGALGTRFYAYQWGTTQQSWNYFPADTTTPPIHQMNAGAIGGFNTAPPDVATANDDKAN